MTSPPTPVGVAEARGAETVSEETGVPGQRGADDGDGAQYEAGDRVRGGRGPREYKAGQLREILLREAGQGMDSRSKGKCEKQFLKPFNDMHIFFDNIGSWHLHP